MNKRWRRNTNHQNTKARHRLTLRTTKIKVFIMRRLRLRATTTVLWVTGLLQCLSQKVAPVCRQVRMISPVRLMPLHPKRIPTARRPRSIRHALLLLNPRSHNQRHPRVTPALQ